MLNDNDDAEEDYDDGDDFYDEGDDDVGGDFAGSDAGSVTCMCLETYKRVKSPHPSVSECFPTSHYVQKMATAMPTVSSTYRKTEKLRSKRWKSLSSE